ncbi:hypothetical protein G6F68_001119 [Rhizopus microsporus]|nr:hypothetical protein G6F67_000817 [Rhizopus microsporus]KAG1268459.1 hypothetical protein G6F68_001119 [Rhizopus microsporus]
MRRSRIADFAKCTIDTINRTILDWYQMTQEDIQKNDYAIGGIDAEGNRIVVEIDESKFGKRKCNREHHVEGVWVVGGVELTGERKCFLVVVPNRTADTLTTIIRCFVKPSSTMYTDCWADYNNLESFEYIHRTVNHSQTFRDGDMCTNTIEGTWNGIKMNIIPSHRGKKMMP